MKNHKKPVIAISSCLLGHNVRYDGGHKYNASLVDFFSTNVEWIDLCPEAELGLGIPRPAMDLYDINSQIELISTEQEILTARMQAWIETKIIEIKKNPVDGFILKSKSPSCGLSTPIYSAAQERLPKKVQGLWAAAVLTHFPHHPVCEEAELQTARQRNDFLKAIHQKQ